MYRLGEARRYLRTAIGSLVLSCLLVMLLTGPIHPVVPILLAPILPLWLTWQALDRRQYPQARTWAWVGAGACLTLGVLVGFPSQTSFLSLIAACCACVAARAIGRVCDAER